MCLTEPTKPRSTEFKEKHQGPVTALAFSLDGSHCASGGEDKAIIVWKTAGEALYTLDAAHGAELQAQINYAALIDDAHDGGAPSADGASSTGASRQEQSRG